MHYLLVEDDDSHAMLTMRTLTSARPTDTVERVADGAAALAYLRVQPPYQDRRRPDLILLDLKLPKVDGHEVLDEVRQDPQLRTIPVVVLTTSDADSDRSRAYESCANSYLIKPMQYDRFRDMVRDLANYWSVWNVDAPLGRARSR